MKILGIDPGSHRIGFSVLERKEKKISSIKVLSYGTIEIPPKTPSPQNLVLLRTQLKKILEEFQPDLASIEELFFANNQKTAKNVFESRGVILLTLAESGIKIIQPTVSQIKKGITGNGKADKIQIKNAIQLLFGITKLKGHDDSWDAIASAFVGLSMSDFISD